jgi:hypothetical protein
VALVLGRFRERGERNRERIGVGDAAIDDASATRKIGVRVEGVRGIVRGGRSGMVARVESRAMRRAVVFRETRDDAVAREGVALVRDLARERLARDKIRVVAVREDVLAGRARVVKGEEERCQGRGETKMRGRGGDASAAEARGARVVGSNRAPSRWIETRRENKDARRIDPLARTVAQQTKRADHRVHQKPRPTLRHERRRHRVRARGSSRVARGRH